MTVHFSPQFYRAYKKADVRIRHAFDQRLEVFKKNPNDLQLNNHPLKREWLDYHSINITADYRAIYTEKQSRGEFVAYFTDIGTHDQLYRRN
jgi:addiction module RelE/StbE family toxin